MKDARMANEDEPCRSWQLPASPWVANRSATCPLLCEMIQKETEDTWCIQCCWVDGTGAIYYTVPQAIHRGRHYGMRRRIHGRRCSGVADVEAAPVVAPTVVDAQERPSPTIWRSLLVELSRWDVRMVSNGQRHEALHAACSRARMASRAQLDEDPSSRSPALTNGP